MRFLFAGPTNKTGYNRSIGIFRYIRIPASPIPSGTTPEGCGNQDGDGIKYASAYPHPYQASIPGRLTPAFLIFIDPYFCF
jgi:hypothetical protein